MHRNKIVKEVVKFIIEADLIELGAINLDHVAQKFSISQSHLCRVFNKTMDTNLNCFFLRIKMLKCALLMHQDPPISIREISKISGFSDKDHFNKVFKMHFGKGYYTYFPFKK